MSQPSSVSSGASAPPSPVRSGQSSPVLGSVSTAASTPAVEVGSDPLLSARSGPIDNTSTAAGDEKDAGMRTLKAGMSTLDLERNRPVLPSPSQQAGSPSTVRPPVAPRQPVPNPEASTTARRPPTRGPAMTGGMKIPPSLQAKMAALASRSSSSSAGSSSSSSSASIPQSPASGPPTATPGTPRAAPGQMRPPPMPAPRPNASAAVPGGLKARKRPGLTLSDMALNAEDDKRGKGAGGDNPTLGSAGGGKAVGPGGTPFSNFSKIVDPSGKLNFDKKAVLHSSGVDFSSGASFNVKMGDFALGEELGKGNYGTVQRVVHKPSGVVMALKEIRLELDDSKLKTIITELDILHRATSPYIIEFYGAFFIESCVYYCMELMDAGSLETVAGCDVPEDVLARVTRSMVEGLEWLRRELKIMHRDVKPTNVLLNKKGQVKLCDFGVSGQLDRSLAKTNIGCQSYMAPERIKGESMGAPTSYTASSDVWSLGLSVIEFAIGHYPYPPETYQNVFAQLTAIVHGDPPTLPGLDTAPAVGTNDEGDMEPRGYSETARDFVEQCLQKQAARRPNYIRLLQHPFLTQDVGREVDMVGWIGRALVYREKHPRINTPAFA